MVSEGLLWEVCRELWREGAEVEVDGFPGVRLSLGILFFFFCSTEIRCLISLSKRIGGKEFRISFCLISSKFWLSCSLSDRWKALSTRWKTIDLLYFIDVKEWKLT